MGKTGKVTAILLSVLLIGMLNGCGSKSKEKVAVFVLDSFIGRDSHGENVSEIFKESCYHVCKVKKISLGSPIQRYKYLEALRKVLEYIEQYPNRRVVLNCSFGSYGRAFEESKLIKEMLDRGVIITAAAGNNNTSMPMYPAAYNGVIAVAALDDEGRKAESSNFGKYIDISAEWHFRTKVSEVKIRNVGAMLERTYIYSIEGGTSFASPRVSGLIAYLLSRKPELQKDELIKIIKETAKPLHDPHFNSGQLGAGELSPHTILWKYDSRYRVFLYAQFILLFTALVFLIVSYIASVSQGASSGCGLIFIFAVFLLPGSVGAYLLIRSKFGIMEGGLWASLLIAGVSIFLGMKYYQASRRKVEEEDTDEYQITDKQIEDFLSRLKRFT